MSGEAGGGFAWGGCASELIRSSKRAHGAQDRLPQYAAESVEKVKKEMSVQVEQAEMLRENPNVDFREYYSTHTLLCEGALRNKRMLHTYARMREHALTDAYWQVGQNLPGPTAACLSPAENTFFRSYSSLCSAYMESHGLNLRASLRRPPHVTDMVSVRGLKDFTYMSPETGQEHAVRRGKLFIVTQEEAEALVQQGSVEPVNE